MAAAPLPNGSAQRMPFSSPMTDISTSSNSSPPLKQKVREKLQGKAPKKTNQSSTKAAQERPVLPTLNLITKFVPTEDGQVLSESNHKRKESLQERRKKARKEGSKGPVEIIKSADGRVSGLSPSDRTLVIGIALQPEKVDAQRGGLVTQNTGNHQGVTPEIVITPAALENPWHLPNARYRPRSSVYSQATQYARGLSHSGNVPLNQDAPPVPPLPANAMKQTHRNARPISAASWHTDFSEDEDLNALRKRYSGESQLGILRMKSTDTAATRHRSRGWWNTLLSPLLDKQSVMATSKSIKALERKTSEIAVKSKFDFDSSPIAEVERGRSETPNTIRTDITPWEKNRETLAFFNDSPTEIKQHPDWERRETVLSADFVPEKGFGEAAEYYEACWHDLHSPTPFFGCENHTCRRLWFYRHGPAIGGPDAAYEAEQRALASSLHLHTSGAERHVGFEDRSRMAVSPLEATRALDGQSTIQATKQPRSPHARNMSDSTEIDEEPDAASEAQTPQSLPNSKAVSPILVVKEAVRNKSTKADHLLFRAAEQGQGATKEGQRAASDQPKPVAPKPSVTALGLPRSSPQPSLTPSPPALTPGLRREFANHNAIAMQPAAAVETAPAAAPVDPSQIQKPRAAPLPPQARSLERGLVASNVGRTPAWSPLGEHEVESQDGLGIHTVRGLPANPSPKPALHRRYESSREVSRERSGSRERLVTAPSFEPPPRAWPIAENKKLPNASAREIQEKQTTKQSEKKWKMAGCIPQAKTKGGKRKRRCCFLIFGVLLAMVILIVILVLTLTIPRSDIPIQSSWLNISGFPPIPTGIATIARPNAAMEFSQCVAPTTMWSCALPKEQQQSIAPNQPDQPNFRIEIRFQNGSAAINSSNSTSSRRSVDPHSPASAGQFIRSQIIKARDSFTNSLFTPNPAPPSQDDQSFLGQYTDNNTAPFPGEQTPFFISFLPTTAASTSKVKRRQDSSLETNSTNLFPNISVAVPPPSVNSDGTAAAANLYPFPAAQPLQLYNRGRSDEHYGFYTYFDRSIFLRSQDLLNSTSEPNVPGDENGGAEESAANVRCTWTQTRFLVQIWTNAGNALQLLSAASSNSTNTSSTVTSTAEASTSTSSPVSGQNSANNFSRPGSFPYPVSITMDRHGGDKDTKMIYCYGMDANERIVLSEKQIHIENRTTGGILVNPSEGIFGQTNVSTSQGGPGGIDGGTGGCKCLWQNWEPAAA